MEERAPCKGSFIVILKVFPKIDSIFETRLKRWKRNSQITTWKIKNETIAKCVCCLTPLILC